MSSILPPSLNEYPTACGGSLTEPGDHPYADYRGKRIYFCLQACKRAFEKNPDDFMAGKIPHPLEEEK
jgi:YHS domain-containing protein